MSRDLLEVSLMEISRYSRMEEHSSLCQCSISPFVSNLNY